MAFPGQVIENPASGERITFRRTAAETVRLAEEARTLRGGIPKPLDLALFLREFGQEVQGAVAPRWVQRLGLAPLAWIGERTDRAALYDAVGSSGLKVRPA